MSRYYYQPGFSVESTDIFNSVFLVEEENKHYPVQVKLKSNAVDFSYVKLDMEHPIHPEVVIPWFSVDLEESEHTDFFLQHAHDHDEHEKIISVEKNSNFQIHYFEGLDNMKFLKNQKNSQSLSVRHILLCLFDDLNNPSGHFRKYSPEMTDAVLNKLNESTVYKLIWRKYSFYRELYYYKESVGHPKYFDKLKVFCAEYLSLLLNDIYYQKIPYKTLKTDDFWLQNPEQELEKLNKLVKLVELVELVKHNKNPKELEKLKKLVKLLKLNKELEELLKELEELVKDSKKTVKDNKKPEEVNLIDRDSSVQIQNYFLKRHAVLNALEINAGSFFIPIIATSVLAALFFLINWICWLNDVFKHTTWIWGTGVACFSASMIIMLIADKKNFINMIMPRILVAVLSILFVIVGTEELFTGLIGINTNGVTATVILSFILLTLFLYSESRQHSPAYKPSFRFKTIKTKIYNIKIAPILIHAFNFTNVLVLLLHLYIMPKIVNMSDYIRSDKFADAFSKIEYTLKDCEEFCENVAKFEQHHNNLSLAESVKYEERLMLDKYHYLSKHLASMINDSLKAVGYSSKDVHPAIRKGQIVDDLRFQLTHFYGVIRQDSILKKICTYQPNTTELLATYPFNSPFSKEYITYEPENVIMIKPLKNSKLLLFPALMIMQVCISLLLGIVGQLIISDKTVTQAL